MSLLVARDSTLPGGVNGKRIFQGREQKTHVVSLVQSQKDLNYIKGLLESGKSCRLSMDVTLE